MRCMKTHTRDQYVEVYIYIYADRERERERERASECEREKEPHNLCMGTGNSCTYSDQTKQIHRKPNTLQNFAACELKRPKPQQQRRSPVALTGNEYVHTF